MYLNIDNVMFCFYLPRWYVLSELLIDDAADRHDEGFAGHIGCVVYPKVIFKVLTKKREKIK